MGFSLRDLWEQADVWDREENARQKQAAQTRRSQTQKQPAQTTRQPLRMSGNNTQNLQNNGMTVISQPKPKQNPFDKFRDIFDANSAMDRYQRQQAGSPELYQDQQRARGVGERSININPAERAVGTLMGIARPVAQGVNTFGAMGEKALTVPIAAVDITRESITGTDESYQRKLNAYNDYLSRGRLGETGGLLNMGTTLQNTDELNDPKRFAGSVLETGSDLASVIAPGMAWKTALAPGVKSAAPQIAKFSAANALDNTVANTGMQLRETGTVDPGKLVLPAAMGAVMPVATYGAGRAVSKGVVQPTTKLVNKTVVSPLKNANLVAPTRLKPEELADLSLGRQKMGTGQMIPEDEWFNYKRAAELAGVDYRDKSAVDNILQAHRTYDVKKQARAEKIDNIRKTLIPDSQRGSAMAGGPFGVAKDLADTAKAKGAPVEKTPTLQDALEGKSTKVTTKPKVAPKTVRKAVPQVSEEMALTKTANQPPTKPPKPPTANGEIPALGTGKQKTTRYASKTVPESEFVSKPIKDTTKKNAPLYTPENEKLRYNEALTKYEKLGRDKFENDLYEQLNVKKGQINSSTVAEAQTLAAKLDAEGNYSKASEVYDKLSEHLTAAGQTIQAASIMARRSPEGLRKHAVDVWKKAGVKVTKEAEEELVRLTQAVKTAKGTEAKAKAIYAVGEHVKKQVPDNWWNKSVNIWRAGLLTSPVTTGGNLLANTGETAIRKGFVNPTATLADAIMGKFTGKRTMTLAQGGAAGKGFKKGAKELPEYMRTGYQSGDANLKAKYENSGTINYGNGKLGKTMGGYVNGVYRLMGVADSPYRYAATQEALSSMAKAEAINKGLKGAARDEFVEQFMKNPPESVMQRASDEGMRATFQNDTLLNDAAQGIKRGLEKKSAPAKAVTDFVMPFVRTPSAIATRLVERTPIGVAKEVTQQILNVRAGKAFDQRAMAQAIGNGSFGAVAIGAGMTLANSDLMTFGYPTEKAERDLWELEGKQPYSVRVGDRWYSLNYLQPFGTLLAIGGQAKNDMDEGLSKSEAVTKALATAGQSIQEQSFLKGINGVLTAISDPEYSARKYMEQTFSSTVPNFVRGFARATDSVQRRPTTVGESVASAIPGLRQTTPVKNDALGRPIPAKDNFLNQYVNPLRPSKVRDDAIAQELRKLKDNDLATMPTDINKSTFGDQQLSKAQINEATQYTNKRVSDEWAKVIKTKEYQSLTDEQKKKTLDSIKKDYHAVAKAEYAAKNNLINDQYEPKLSARQKQVASGEAPDYVYGGLPDNLSKTAKNTLITADGKDDAWKQSKNTDTEVTKELQSWLPQGVQLPEFTNEVAKEWANLEKRLAEGKVSKFNIDSEKKSVLRTAFNSQLNPDERELYKLSEARLYDAIDKGMVTEENINRALAVEKQLFDAGLISKEGLAKKLGVSARGYKTSSRSGRSSGSRKTKSLGMDYKLFGFGDPKNAGGQSLRKLLEKYIV